MPPIFKAFSRSKLPRKQPATLPVRARAGCLRRLRGNTCAGPLVGNRPRRKQWRWTTIFPLPLRKVKATVNFNIRKEKFHASNTTESDVKGLVPAQGRVRRALSNL